MWQISKRIEDTVRAVVMGIFVTSLALPSAVEAAHRLKTLHVTVIDTETGSKVTGECFISTDVDTGTFYETNAGGEESVTLDSAATSAFVSCNTAAGSSDTIEVALREHGVTHVDVFV